MITTGTSPFLHLDSGNDEPGMILQRWAGREWVDYKVDGKPEYKKVIVEPLIKLEGCNYIVAGVIEFYLKDKWIATLDYGDGSCDEWATKKWDGGSEVISLAKN